MSQPRILIIDDEPLMRISIADALKAEGYQVKVAATGSDCVVCIKKEKFNIIISDLRLPGLDGLQVLQTCKEVSARTGVIVITAHGSVETAVEAMKMGAYDYITKPFSMDELLLIVKRLVKLLELEDENRSLRQRKGRFELAHHGTLFLDEIGEISQVVQVKLLRVLQERQFERVGGTSTIEVDVRLVCATQRDLKKEVQSGRFREDLYYRLIVVPVYLPPLRDRKEDVLLLAEHFLEKFGNRMGKRRGTLAQGAKGKL